MRTMFKTLACAGTAVAALIGATGASSASLVNGDFEQCAQNCPTNLTPLAAGNGQLTGWTVSSDNGGNANKAVEWVTYDGGTGWNAASGNYSIALSGANAGEITQTIATKEGVTYDISFDVAGNPKNIGLEKYVGLTINGNTNVFGFKDTSTSNANMGWTLETYQFTATSDSTVLSLFNDHPGLLKAGDKLKLYGMALDDVSIQAVGVPEPGTWAMMILGVAGIGGMARTRRRAAIAA